MVETNTSAQALAMVAHQRVEAAVLFGTLKNNLELQYIQSGLLERSPKPLFEEFGHTLLHEKHRELAVYLDEVLKEIKIEGLMDIVMQCYNEASRKGLEGEHQLEIAPKELRSNKNLIATRIEPDPGSYIVFFWNFLR